MSEKPIFKKVVDYKEAKKLVDRMHSDGGFPSGYKDLNNLTGGLVRDGVTLIAGRPAMGKSSLTYNMISRLSKQLEGAILVISAHASPWEVTTLLQSIETGLRPEELFDGRRSAEELSEKYKELFCSRKSKIWIETPTAPSLEGIWWECRRTPDLRLVVVNNIQNICKPLQERQFDVTWYENYEEKDKVLRTLKSYAERLRVPIICTANLHRSLERRKNKRPCLRDLEKTGYSPELADQIIFLYRDRYYDFSGEEGAEWIVAKSPQGNAGTVYLDWDYLTHRFLEQG